MARKIQHIAFTGVTRGLGLALAEAFLSHMIDMRVRSHRKPLLRMGRIIHGICISSQKRANGRTCVSAASEL